jgi:hypothetical protein
MPEPAAAAAANAIRQVEIGEPREWRGLTVFPLTTAADSPEPAYDMFGMAAAAGTFVITEVSEGGSVGQLRAVNTGMRPVLLLDGEEVVGAKQNRIINLTVLVAAGTTVELPVSCVEQGRWSMQSRAFAEAGRTMFARGRARKMRDVTVSMRASGRAVADQGAVWNDVASYLSETGTHSPTAAMSEGFETSREDVEACVASLAAGAGEVGAVFAVGGRVAGVELFDSPAAWQAATPKILRSYAVEARSAATDTVTEGAVRTFLASLCAAPATEHPAVGAGTQVRVDDSAHTGAALVHDGRAIHVMGFHVAPPPSHGDPPGS